MKMRYSTLVLCLGWILFATLPALLNVVSAQAPAAPTTWYVSTVGSDSNPGTQAAPFKTPQHASDVYKAGDTIYLVKGKFPTGIDMLGRVGHVTITGDEGATIAGITGNVNLGNFNAAEINVEDTPAVTVKGITIAGGGGEQKAGIRLATSNGSSILNCTVNGAFIGIFESGSSGFTIDGNTCTNSTDQHGIYISSNSRNYTVSNNTCSGNHWDGLHFNCLNGSPNTGGVIQGNISTGNGLSGFDIEGVSLCQFTGNDAHGNTKHGMTLHSQDQGNTPFTGAAGANTFSGNKVYGNGMFALQIQAGDDAENLSGNWFISGGQGAYGSIGTNGIPTKLASNGNVVSNSFSNDLGKTAITLAQWQQATGQDKASVIGTNSTALPGAPASQPASQPATQPAVTIAQLQSQLKQAQTGDLNLDGKVDQYDLLILLKNYKGN